MKIQFKTAAFLFAGLLFVLSSCKKQSISDETAAAGPTRPAENVIDVQAANLVRTWLTNQHSTTDPLKTEKIRLLEEKLDFAGMRVKRLNAEKQLLVVPIRPGLSTVPDDAGMNVLLLQQDESGNIRSGNVVQYTTQNPGNERRPDAVLAMYDANAKSNSANYSFLTITGHAFRKISYQGGKIQSYSALQKNVPGAANKPTQDPISPDQICTDWYWVTTTYYADGHTETTSSFAYRTCETTSGGGPTPDCGAVNDELEGYSISEDGSMTVLYQTAKTRTKLYCWTFYRQWFGMWRFDSYEEGIHTFVNNEWVWKSLTHKSISRVGWTVGGSVNATVLSAIPSIAKYWAGMELAYSIELSAICKGSPISTTATHRTGSPRWQVNA
jgi:hypothetical protein